MLRILIEIHVLVGIRKRSSERLVYTHFIFQSLNIHLIESQLGTSYFKALPSFISSYVRSNLHTSWKIRLQGEVPISDGHNKSTCRRCAKDANYKQCTEMTKATAMHETYYKCIAIWNPPFKLHIRFNHNPLFYITK